MWIHCTVHSFASPHSGSGFTTSLQSPTTWVGLRPARIRTPPKPREKERQRERERQKKEKKRAGPLSLEQARVRARARHGEMGRGLLRRRSRLVGHVPRKRKQGKRQHCGLARSGEQNGTNSVPPSVPLDPQPLPKRPFVSLCLSPSVSLRC